MIRRVIFICLSVLCTKAFCSEVNPTRDSLLNRLAVTPHTERRLETLLKLVQATDGSLDENCKYNDLLLEEAQRQGNDRYICEAYFTRLITAYNTYNIDVVLKTADILLPITRKNKQYDLMFRTWSASINILILRKDFERVEKEANKMLAEAKAMNNATGIVEAHLSLSHAYRATFRNTEAVDILEKALPIAEQIDRVYFNVWQALLFLYSDANNYEKWLRHLHRADVYFSKFPADMISERNTELLILYTSYLDYYTRINELQQAERYRQKVEQLITGVTSPLYKIYFYQTAAPYYNRKKLHEDALEYLRKASDEMATINIESDYYAILQLQGNQLYTMERHEEAIAIYKKTLAFKDSVQLAAIGIQNEQLKKDYKADQMLLDSAQLRYRIQTGMLLLLLIGIGVVIGFILYLLRSQRVLRNAEEEMRSMAKKMKLVNEAKTRFLSNISTTIREPLNCVVEGSLQLATQRITYPEQQQRLSSDIRQMSASLMSTINDILDLSRLEAGVMKFENVETEVVSMLYDAICAMETPENRIEVHTQYPENTLYMAILDANRLVQILKRLLKAADKKIIVTVAEQNGQLSIRISGSAYAVKDPDQETIIRSEINRMLIVIFGGDYQTDSATQEVSLLLPIDNIIRPN